MMKIYKYTTSGTNLFDPSATDTTKGYVSGKYLNNDGTMTDNVDWSISEYIEIPEGTTQLTFTVVGNAPSVCLYDANKEFKIGENYNNRTTFTFNTQDKYKYFRLSYKMIYESDYSVTSNALGWRETEGYQYKAGENLMLNPILKKETSDYITANGTITPGSNGDKFYLCDISANSSTSYNFVWDETIIGNQNNPPYIRISEYNGETFIQRTLIDCSNVPSNSVTLITTSSTTMLDIRYDYKASRGQTITGLKLYKDDGAEVKWRETTAHEYSSGSWD